VSVADCEDQIQRTKYALEDAERHDADADAERLKTELKRLRIELNEVRDRTTQRNNTGMMVGGIILSSVGGAGILVALGAGAALSISGGRDNGAGTVAMAWSEVSPAAPWESPSPSSAASAYRKTPLRPRLARSSSWAPRAPRCACAFEGNGDRNESHN
jgi:hypothetical protein